LMGLLDSPRGPNRHTRPVSAKNMCRRSRRLRVIRNLTRKKLHEKSSNRFGTDVWSRANKHRTPPREGVRKMPRISRFYGIAIAMYYNDHAPPHFHVKYAEHEAS